MSAQTVGLGLVDDATAWISHVAGDVTTGLQTCRRCHVVLVDDRKPHHLDGRRVPRLYRPDSPVVRLGDVVTAPARPGRLPAGSRPCQPIGDPT